MKKGIYIVVCLFFVSCAKNPETYIPFVEGYWEISQVKKDNNLIKEYSISTIVDYFEVKDDLTGFRKKVTPTLDGTFKTNSDATPFTLEIIDNALFIIYTTEDSFKETILKATSTELIIANSDGFVYIYKPFEKISFD